MVFLVVFWGNQNPIILWFVFKVLIIMVDEGNGLEKLRYGESAYSSTNEKMSYRKKFRTYCCRSPASIGMFLSHMAGQNLISSRWKIAWYCSIKGITDKVQYLHLRPIVVCCGIHNNRDNRVGRMEG